MNPIHQRHHQAVSSYRSITSSRHAAQSAGADSATVVGAEKSAPKEGLLQTLDSQSRQNALSNSTSDSSSSKSEQPAGSELAGSGMAVSTLSEVAVTSAIAADTSGLEAAKSAMQNNLKELASSPEKFHAAMQKSFGAGYDHAKAETIRQQVLEGDFSWMPEIRVVDESVLMDQSGQQGDGVALGAYSADNDTIYISQQLLESDPSKAVQILTEEVGHGLDARLNTSDAAGDEGDIFSRLVAGEQISDSELADLRSENDSGIIVVDGKEVEVEFFIKKLVKKAVDAVKDVGRSIAEGVGNVVDAVADTVSDAWQSVKKIGKKILTNPLISQLMTVAQFIPIPIVQVVAKGYNVLKAAYAFGKGIQHGSVAMILGGAAGLAGGIGNFGNAVGMSQSFVDTAGKIATGLGKASTAYQVLATKDFAAAAALASNYFGGSATSTGRAFQTAGQVIDTAERVENGDYVGALSSGADIYKGFRSGSSDSTSSRVSSEDTAQPGDAVADSQPGRWESFVDNITGSQLFTTIADNISTVRSIVRMAKTDGLGAASQALFANYGDSLGIDSDKAQVIIKWAGVLDTVKVTADMVKGKDYSGAIEQAADLLGIPLTDNNRQRLDTAFQLRESVLSDSYPDAARQAAVLSMQTGNPELAADFLRLANWLVDGNTQPVAQQAA